MGVSGTATTPSAPKQCPDCGSNNLGNPVGLLGSGGASVLCFNCGVFVQLEPETEKPQGIGLWVGADVCPHCRFADRIKTWWGGEEWCDHCGLDPSILDYPSEAIAYLWKKGSGIQRAMERQVHLLSSTNRMGRFLRSECGPHCSLSASCPQEVGNFIRCFKEDYPTEPPGEDMSKKSRKARKRGRRLRREAMEKANGPAMLLCAQAGWFEKVMYANPSHPQQVGDTGTGSRT